MGRTYNDEFIFAIERPVSLNEGMIYLNSIISVEEEYMEFISEEDGLNLYFFEKKAIKSHA